mgnify:CR=1 FL=1
MKKGKKHWWINKPAEEKSAAKELPDFSDRRVGEKAYFENGHTRRYNKKLEMPNNLSNNFHSRNENGRDGLVKGW